MMMAQVTGLETGDFIYTTGDTHIYTNHFEQVKIQMGREPLPLPILKLNPDVTSIFDFHYDDFELLNYNSWPHISGAVSI
jgi:thymidylate synthase